jgi:glycosyltransferase involved in cell wall biosynthesis
VRERIEAQGLAALIRRIGHCSDMPAAYAVGDMTVVPTYEPMTSDPIVLESQAMARPVVATNIGALPETVPAPPFFPEDERTGWIVPPDDPVELARAIAAVLALDPHSARRIGDRARAFADQFSPTRVAAGILSVYTSLLEGGE